MNVGCKIHLNESKNQLKNGGLKITRTRLALLDIFKHAKKPLSIKNLAAKFRHARADLVTLYRNVEILLGLGLVRRIILSDKQAFYELSGEHHHHLICQKCGKIRDVKICAPAISKFVLKQAEFAQINSHSLEYFGICDNCEK